MSPSTQRMVTPWLEDALGKSLSRCCWSTLLHDRPPRWVVGPNVVGAMGYVSEATLRRSTGWTYAGLKALAPALTKIFMYPQLTCCRSSELPFRNKRCWAFYLRSLLDWRGWMMLFNFGDSVVGRIVVLWSLLRRWQRPRWHRYCRYSSNSWCAFLFVNRFISERMLMVSLVLLCNEDFSCLR